MNTKQVLLTLAVTLATIVVLSACAPPPGEASDVSREPPVLKRAHTSPPHAAAPASGCPAANAPRPPCHDNWISLFNGKDLTGWKPIGHAAWKVENGDLIGTQGPQNAPGDLLTESSYKDFVLKVMYRIEWPANSGVWFRYQTENKTYQADVLEYTNPVAYSGTIYCPGKLFIAVNTDPDLVNRTGWNTCRVRAEGTHLQIWLNDHLTGDVVDNTSDQGQIGFQVHPGDQFGKMKIIVREIKLMPLGPAK